MALSLDELSSPALQHEIEKHNEFNGSTGGIGAGNGNAVKSETTTDSHPSTSNVQDAQGAFEFYDPRGLFSRRRSSVGGSNSKAARGEIWTGKGSLKRTDSNQDAPASALSTRTSSVGFPDRPDSQYESTSSSTTVSSPIAIPSQFPSSTASPTPQRPRLSRIQTEEEFAVGNGRLSSRKESDASLQPPSSYIDDDDMYSRFGLSRQESTSRSRSPSARTPESSAMSGSAIISPAAEFLGSFSSSIISTGSATGGRGRSATTATQPDGLQNGPFKTSSSIMSFIAPDPDSEGQEVNGYILEKSIGHGTFSTVRRARNVQTGEVVAVKIVRHHDFRTMAEGEESVMEWGSGSAQLSKEGPPGRSPGSESKGKGTENVTTEQPRVTRMRSCSSPMIQMPTVSSLTESLDTATPGRTPDGVLAAPFSDTPLSTDTDSSLQTSSDEEGYEIGPGDQSLADPALQKEVQIWSQLSPHPHILPLLDYFEDDFASYIFMPLCRGGNLLEYLKEYNLRQSLSSSLPRANKPISSTRMQSPMDTSNSDVTQSPQSLKGYGRPSASVSPTGVPEGNSNKPHRSTSIRIKHPGELSNAPAGLPLSVARKIFSQIVSGLLYLHAEAKVTHKDIKLENILLDFDGVVDDDDEIGSKGVFKISDFGLAYATEIVAKSALLHRRKGALNGRDRRKQALSEGGIGDATPSTDITMDRHGRSATISHTEVPFTSLGEAAAQILPESHKFAYFPGDKIYPSDFSTSSPSPRAPPTTSGPGSSLHRVVSLHNPSSTLARRRLASTQAVPANLSSSISSFDSTMGSLQYTSPEQVRSPTSITSQSVDVWALGCVLFALLDGRLPFDDGFEPRLRVNIIKGQWNMPKVLKRNGSNTQPSNANDGTIPEEDEEKAAIECLLNGCLDIDPSTRWTIEQIAQCEWLRGYIPSLSSPTSPVPTYGSQRGRKRETNIRLPEQPVSQLLDAKVERSRSRGRRQDLWRTSSSQDRLGRDTSSRSGSRRRLASQEEYRRARGESQKRSPTGTGSPTRGRSTSRGRRYGGEASNSWEIL